MSNPRKPKVVGPFEGVNPPNDMGSPPVPESKSSADSLKPSPEVMRKLEEERRLQELRDESGRAAETSRRSSMGTVKKASGGSVSSASKRADGCAQRGKTKGRFI